MNRCKDCKWWEEYKDDAMVGVCVSPTVKIYDTPAESECSTDGPLYIGPLFGCVNFTPKDGEA